MKITITQEAGCARLHVDGDVDERGAEELKRRFRELNVASLAEAVFDFSNVGHIGSAGIGKLLLFYKDMAVGGGKIRIENLNEAVYDLFALLKLETIFTLSKA